MKSNAKSSVTLPAEEVELVLKLKKRLRLKSNVDVVRRGLRLLQEMTDRRELKRAFQRASQSVRVENSTELDELDDLAGEGLD